MRQSKVLLVLALVFAFFAFLLPSKVMAATSHDLGIVQNREDGYAYKIRTGGTNPRLLDVWKIVEYINNSKTWNNAIYCIKGGPGFGGTITSPVEIRTYNVNYDMKKISDIPSNYLSTLPTDTVNTATITVNEEEKNITYTNYNAVLWLIDNMYLPKDANATKLKENLLKAAFKKELETQYANGPFTIDQITLTDSDIEFIQQLAIWHFTNAGDNEYDMGENLPAIQISQYGSTTNYTSLPMDREDDARTLYKYLIENAMLNANSYGTEGDRHLTAPIQVINTILGSEIIDNDLVIGPFKMEKQSELPYTLTATVLNQNEAEVTNYSIYIEQNGNKVKAPSNTTIASLVDREFYIAVPKTSGVTSVTLDISVDYYESEANFWTVSGSNADQPVVMVDKKIKNLELKAGSIFDLALRKFITKVNSTDVTDRVPTVNVANDGKITYTHTKNPVEVESGDIVTYTIRIYNEGNVSGYAQEIKDNIPISTLGNFELEFLDNHETNIRYGWKLSADGKYITTDYLSKEKDSTNNLIRSFDLKGYLNATSENDKKDLLPDYRDVQVAFKVITPNSYKNIITNIAEISEDADENGNPVDDIDSTPNNNKDGEDDIDKEYLKLKTFDLALRKFITKVISGQDETVEKIPNPSREPRLEINNSGRIIYKHDKTPIPVHNGDIVVYTIRVYNEGQTDGYAQNVTDYLPEGTEFIVDNQINIDNKWVFVNGDTKIITTDILKYDALDTDNTTLLKAYKGSVDTISYKDLQVAVRVTEPDSSAKILINTAEIAEDADKYGKTVDDIDSIPNNKNEEGKDSNHNFKEDDIDKEYIKLEIFDLALRKFITGVNDTEVNTRIPEVRINQETKKITYIHDKTPVAVKNGDLVTYTLRIYNEGNSDGYAETIRDNVPEGLEYVPNNSTNRYYGWKLENDGTVTTDYLSKAKADDNILRAFITTTEEGAATRETPDYKDIKIVFKVVEPNNSKKILINTAEIADDADSDGNPVNDVDSVPDNKNEEGKDENHNFKEDDIDKEYLKLKEFDLALRKFITGVNNTDVTTRIPEVQLNEGIKKITYIHDKTPVLVANGDIVTYTLRIYNEGEIDGYAETIYDDVPEGLEFLPNNSINVQYGWKQGQDGSITTDYLSHEKNAVNGLIKKFDRTTMQTPDYKDVKIAFKVVEPNNSKNILINTAEIAEDADSNGNPVEDIDSIPGNKNEEGKDENHNFKEDDIDKEYLRLKEFDLALRKFITGVNDTEITTRIPQISKNEETGKITYIHTKEPVYVASGDTVVYTIRVYNEGQISGYAESIRDDVPEGLEFIKDNSINKQYGWVLSEDGKELSTDYLSKEKAEGNLIESYNGTDLKYKDVKIAFKVIEKNNSDKILINTAEIKEDADQNGNPVEDIDSIPGNKNEEGKDENHNFKEDDIDKEYIRVHNNFDLALRKFITAVNDKEVTTRIPEPKYDAIAGKITYIHDKTPVLVTNNDIVTYTIRVYNEGDIDGFAEIVRDDVPQYLEFLPDNNINKQYGWVLAEDGTVSTDYLSKAKAEDNLIKGFDKQNLSFKDVKIAFKVTSQKLDTDNILINTAEIAEDADSEGNPIDDIDSIPGNKNEEGKDENHNFKEDDIDKEYVRVHYFDLSLLKWVNKVILTEDGVTTEKDTGHNGLENPEPVVKQEINRKKLDKTTVKFEYTIKITNEGQIAGYAKEISDYIPEGLEFVAEDNPNWTQADGKVTTRALEGTLLNPGESAEVKIILRWIRNAENMGVKTNIAEISEDYNEYNVPDIDSVPNNKVEGEDDIDTAPVALSISTGAENVIYFGLIGTVLASIVGGVALIRKYVI